MSVKNEKCGAVGVVTKKKCVCHATANLFRGKMLSLQQNCKRMDDKFVLRDSAEVVNRKLDLLFANGLFIDGMFGRHNAHHAHVETHH